MTYDIHINSRLFFDSSTKHLEQVGLGGLALSPYSPMFLSKYVRLFVIVVRVLFLYHTPDKGSKFDNVRC